MQNIREILEVFIDFIKEEVDKKGLEIIDQIDNLVSRADFRRRYYRLKVWEMLSKLGDTTPSIQDVIESLLTDLSAKWENTLVKALNDGILNA